MKKNLLIIVCLLALSTLAACQEQGESKNTQTDAVKSEQQKVVDHGIPVSKGPTAPLTDEGGPTTPPPENIVKATQAQAITTNENIRLTLPRKTN